MPRTIKSSDFEKELILSKFGLEIAKRECKVIDDIPHYSIIDTLASLCKAMGHETMEANYEKEE